MYERIVGLVKKSRPEYRRLCKSHYAYINRKFGMRNYHLLSLYLQGALMRLRGDKKRMRHMNSETKKQTEVLTRSLVPLVHSAPKTKTQITLLRAHHFSKIPKVGSLINFDVPMSTSMYHPFVVEWVVARKHNPKYKPVILVINVPANKGDLLCVGCPMVYHCTANHQRTFRVGPRTDWAFERLDQNQIQSQSEVILAPGVFQVTGSGRFMARDINDMNQYGLGWYTNVVNGNIPPNKMVQCVFVDVL